VTADEAPLAAAAEHHREGEVDRAIHGARADDRADASDAQRDRASVDELARDADLLSARRWVDAPQELDELALRPIGTVDEGEDTDDQGEQRDEREEELIGDAAREERALIGRERRGDGTREAAELSDAL